MVTENRVYENHLPSPFFKTNGRGRQRQGRRSEGTSRYRRADYRDGRFSFLIANSLNTWNFTRQLDPQGSCSILDAENVCGNISPE